MKKIILALLILPILIYSCNDSATTATKDTSAATEKKETSGTENVITFKVNGEMVTSSGFNLSRTIMGGRNVLSISSDMHKEPRTIMLNINGNKASIFKLGAGMDAMRNEGMGYGSYRPDYIKDMMNHFDFQDGEINISTLDTVNNVVNATFSGNVKNEKNQTFSITDGKVINCKIRPGLTIL